MALFANAIDLRLCQDQNNTKLASVNFVASSRVSEALAQSGHLALSAPSQIMGQFQFLKVSIPFAPPFFLNDLIFFINRL